MVALRAGQPERPLLEDRIASVPQREPQAQPLLDVGKAGQAILAPPVRLGPGLVVREIVPGIPVRAVVPPDRAPLTLAHVGAPQVPVARLPQTVLKLPESFDPLT